MAENQLPAYLQSVFYPLFQHAKDLECRLLLIDQILQVGDKKEIPFLAELETHDNPKISNKAFEVKGQLMTRLGLITESERKRLPMNLCFIYDEFSIRPSKVDPDLDFEIALDILEMDKKK